MDSTLVKSSSLRSAPMRCSLGQEKVPTGVPASVLVPLPLLFPPHPTKAAASNVKTSNPNASRGRRRLPGRNSRQRQKSSAPSPTIGQLVWFGGLIAAWAPVVVTVSVVLPLVEMEAGFMAQLLSVIAEGTAQVKLTVPVNPLRALSVITEVWLWPGAEMTMLPGLAVSVVVVGVGEGTSVGVGVAVGRATVDVGEGVPLVVLAGTGSGESRPEYWNLPLIERAGLAVTAFVSGPPWRSWGLPVAALAASVFAVVARAWRQDRCAGALLVSGLAFALVAVLGPFHIPGWQFFNMRFSPLAAVLLVYALLQSMTLTLWRGGVVWRGTKYPLKELRRI